MRERSLDEFESIFEQASIPVLDIKTVSLTRISAVLTGGPLDASVLKVAMHLNRRLASEVRLHWTAVMTADQVQETARDNTVEADSVPFASTAELVGQISIARSRLLLMPVAEGETATPIDLDEVVGGTVPPVLIIRTAIEDPAAAFGRILHSLTGNFRQTQNFAHSFTLAEDGGRLLLLHVIDDNELEDVRDALQVSPDIAEEPGEELLQNLTQHGERYLRAIVAAGLKRPFDVAYRLAVGNVIDAVRAELDAGDYGLLVVGKHHEGYSHVSADDYQLMHQVCDIPVLAL